MVGDFVPFYFCPRSLMLYVISKANHPQLAYRGGQRPIVHLEADLHETVILAQQQQRKWAFTASNATARYTRFHNDINDLQMVDWTAVRANNWAAPNIREGKQAEFLFQHSFPWSLIRRIGVYSQGVYTDVQSILTSAQHKPRVEIKQDWYY
jgi:ssDNA thymidine ADP-ribosyltransferase, DarT